MVLNPGIVFGKVLIIQMIAVMFWYILIISILYTVLILIGYRVFIFPDDHCHMVNITDIKYLYQRKR